jgi:hypothetical protein
MLAKKNEKTGESVNWEKQCINKKVIPKKFRAEEDNNIFKTALENFKSRVDQSVNSKKLLKLSTQRKKKNEKE